MYLFTNALYIICMDDNNDCYCRLRYEIDNNICYCWLCCCCILNLFSICVVVGFVVSCFQLTWQVRKLSVCFCCWCWCLSLLIFRFCSVNLFLEGLVLVVQGDLLLVKSSVFRSSSSFCSKIQLGFLFLSIQFSSSFSLDSGFCSVFSVSSVLDLGSFWASSVRSRLVPFGALVHSSLFA